MSDLSVRFAGPFLSFMLLFVYHSLRHAQILPISSILISGCRTVTNVLRMVAVLERSPLIDSAAWCAGSGNRILLGLLIAAFAPHGPVVLRLDDTIEHRRRKCIALKGIYREPVRLSDSHFVKTSRLRWMSLMLLAAILGGGARLGAAVPDVPALFMHACRERGRRHKPLLDAGRQLALQTRCWIPQCDFVVMDDSFWALLSLHVVRRGRITRLRLDSALYEPAAPRPAGMNGRLRTEGLLLPTLATTLTAEDTLWRRLTGPG